MTYEISSENVGIYSKPARMSNIVFFSKVPQQLGASYFKKSVNFFNKIIITQTLFQNIMLVICWFEFVVIFGKWNKGKPGHKLEKTKSTQGEFMQKLYTCILKLKQVLKAVRHLLEQIEFVERWHRHFTMKNEDGKSHQGIF